MSEEDDKLAMELNASSNEADLDNMATEPAPIEDFDPEFVKELRKLNKIHRKQNNFSTDKYDVKDFQLKEYIKINKKTNYKYYGVVNKFYQYHRNKIYKEMNFKNVDENAPIELDDINIKLDNLRI